MLVHRWRERERNKELGSNTAKLGRKFCRKVRVLNRAGHISWIPAVSLTEN